MEERRQGRKVLIHHGKETRLFAPFDTKNDRFTKTGSGKMYGKLKKDAFLQAVLLMATST